MLEENNAGIDENLLTQVTPCFWPLAYQALPNVLARTALFTTSKNPPKVLQSEKVFSFKNIEIYRGMGDALTLFDCSVFMAISDLKKLSSENGEITSGSLSTNLYSVAIAMGIPRPGPGIYTDIEASLYRLRDATISINFKNEIIKKISYNGGLISEFRIFVNDDDSISAEIKFSEIELLYNSLVGVTWYLKEDLQNLKKRPLAKKIFLYLFSHKKLNDLYLETWKNLTGSRSSTREFKRSMREALQYLKEIKMIKSFRFRESTESIEKDIVVIEVPNMKRHMALEFQNDMEND